MRSATLSCITFQWMSTRAHWSFQAVRGQLFSPPILNCHFDLNLPRESEASMWASIVAKPLFLLFATRPICLNCPLQACANLSSAPPAERGHPVPFSLKDLINYAPSFSLIHAVCVILHLSLALCFSFTKTAYVLS